MAHNFRSLDSSEPARRAPRREHHLTWGPAPHLVATATSEPTPIGLHNQMPLESSALCIATDDEIKDAVAALAGLLDGNNGGACSRDYTTRDYANDIRNVLSREGFLLPPDAEIRCYAKMTLSVRGDKGARTNVFRDWVGAIPLAKGPIAVIRNAAEKISGCHVFMSEAFSNSFERRTVGNSTPYYIASPTTDKIIGSKDEIMSHLIGGASGSGKTMSLVGFGKPSVTRCVFPVLFQPQDFGKMLLIQAEDSDSGLSKDMAILERKERNDKFLGALVALVESIIPAPALSALRRPAEAGVTIVLAMDEAGMSPQMVRAMASLEPSTVREELDWANMFRCGSWRAAPALAAVNRFGALKQQPSLRITSTSRMRS